MTADEMTAFLAKEFPQVADFFTVETVGDGEVRVRMGYDERHLRPGGTMSGPSMMALADCSVYLAIMSRAGPVMLAVTSNLNINFLRRPKPADLIAEARLLKLGRRLAVGEVAIHSDGEDEIVAHAVLTYSIPEARP